MKVSEIMTRNPETFSSDTPLHKIAQEMERLDCGFIPIAEDGKLVGTVTDRDIAIRAVAKGKDPKTTSAKDIMTREHFTITESENVDDAAHQMCQKQIRRLVVIDNKNNICGVVSLSDIATKCQNHQIDSDIIESVSEKAA